MIGCHVQNPGVECHVTTMWSTFAKSESVVSGALKAMPGPLEASANCVHRGMRLQAALKRFQDCLQ